MPDLMFLINSLLDIGVVAFLVVMNAALWPISSFILPKIKSKTAQVYFHLIYGVFLSVVLFKQQIIYPIAFAVISYFVIDKGPVIGCSFALFFNTLTNLIYKLQDTNTWEFEVTCMTMIQFQRICSTSFNIAHGKQETFKRPFYKPFAMKQKPSFLFWFAYLFTPIGAFSGPTFEYNLFDYILDCGNRPKIASNSRSRKMAIRRWLEGILFSVFNVLFMSSVGIGFYSQPFFLKSPTFVRLLLMLVCTCGQACRYFPAWSTIEASIYELGLGESELINDFYDVSNMSIFDLLASNSVGIWLQRWNHSSHIFFKRYLFYPLYDNNYGYAIAHHSVFIASALWHGFEPVYFLVLPEMICSTIADDLILQYLPYEKMPIWLKPIYHFWIILCMFNTTSTWWYRTYDSFFFVRRSVKYLGTIIIFTVFIIMFALSLIKPPKKRPRKKKEVKVEENTEAKKTQ